MASANPRTADAPAFELKGTALTLMVLHPFATDAARIGRELEERSTRAPDFFRDAPLVLDLSGMQDGPEDLDLTALAASVRRAGMVPVGVRGASPRQRELAVAAGLGWIANPGRSRDGADAPCEPEVCRASHRPVAGNGRGPQAVVVTQPVRSGQRLVAPDGDLVVLSSVNPGAEVLAGRHIHVYGPLRGRALAGASGDTEARIFSAQFAPELVAIAGEYVVSDDLEPECLGRSTMVYLEDGALRIQPITGLVVAPP
ncbi:MAG: septum site-determining protein MinC [Candidatus Latescibacterota bacterium]